MPFPFVLSTTSHLTFQSNFSSTTHPSLPAVTTARRNVLRSALKSHKRMSVADQANNIPNLISCLTEYLKYLNTLNAALSGKIVNGEEIDLAFIKEVEVEWRSTLLSSTVPGKETDRIKGRGLDFEIYSVHNTFSTLYNLLARQALLGLYATTSPTADQRRALVQNAMKSLCTVYSVHTHLIHLSNSAPDGPPSFPPSAIDISTSTQSSLQRLAAAEVNLLAVLKDDPYPSLLVQTRNELDKEWMIRAPTIPKVRAQVLTRLCIGAAEHATAAGASLKVEGRKIQKDLVDYTEDLRRTARARACRFQALDNDLAGQTGQAIAWLYAAQNELGIEVTVKEGSSKTSKIDKLRSSWNERREDKRIAKADPRWGADGGKAEEGRVVEYLHRRYAKANNTINIQVVPEWRPLLAMLPSGMNMPIDEKWKDIVLEEQELTDMRAPPDEQDILSESSGEDDVSSADRRTGIAGAFPGTREEYAGRGTSYY